MSASAPSSSKKKNSDEDQDLNIHLLMEEIKKEILQVYSYTDNHMDPAALEGKKTIEILNVSFLRPLIDYLYRKLN